MECLKGYIGLRDCSEIEPESNLWVNELPGVNLKSTDQIADSDQVTFVKVWADVEKRSLKRFSSAVTTYFSTKYRLARLLDRYRFGLNFDKNKTLPPTPNSLRGIIVKLDKNNTTPEVSPLVHISVSNLEYLSDSIATINFKIADQDTGEIYWEKDIDVIQGRNTVLKEWSTPVLVAARNLAIFYQVITTTIETTIGDANGSCGCSIGCCSAIIEGFTYDENTLEITTTATNGHGLSGFISLQCSFDGLVCASKSLFSTALWYLLGAELMTERIYTDRINAYTTVDRKKSKELLGLFEQRYADEMDLIVEGISLKTTDCCLECDPPIRDQVTIG